MEICIQCPLVGSMRKSVDSAKLAKESKYFQSLFEGKIGSADNTTAKVIEIHDPIEADMFWVMAQSSNDFKAIGGLSLSLKQYFALAIVCDRFMYDSLLEHVMTILKDLLLKRVGREYEFVEAPGVFCSGPGLELTELATERMVANFNANRGGFSCMAFESVCTTLIKLSQQNDNNNVLYVFAQTGANAIYQCLVDWWQGPYSPCTTMSERRECAAKLIQLIQFDKMSARFLIDVVDEDRSITSLEPELVSMWDARVASASFQILKRNRKSSSVKEITAHLRGRPRVRLVRGTHIDLWVNLALCKPKNSQTSPLTWISGVCFNAWGQTKEDGLLHIGVGAMDCKTQLGFVSSLSLILPDGSELVLSGLSTDGFVYTSSSKWIPRLFDIDMSVESLLSNKTLGRGGMLHFRIHIDGVRGPHLLLETSE